jgi:hypothetical protein
MEATSALLSNNLSTEVARASAAEGVLRTTMVATSALLSASINTTNNNLSTEVARASAAEGVLRTTIGSVSADLASEVSRATTAESAISSRVSQISSNYLDKRTGGIVTGNLDVTGTISATGGLEISGGGASTSLFVGNSTVGINTETPFGAFEVVGNGKISGTLLVATPSLSGHAANKGYVDIAIANLVDGAPVLLDTLNELAAAINDDASFSATIATNIGNISTALASASATLTSKIDSEVSTLNTKVASVSASLNSKIDTRISSLSSTVYTNFVEKTESDAVILNGGLTITNGISADILTTSGIVSLGNGKITTDNSGNMKVLGTVTVATPTLSGHAATKNYVDYMVSVLNGGTF